MKELATLASGCFWCTEAIFKRVNGVISATSGYSGGNVENPTYEMLHMMDTGHAEAVQIEFDPEIISYKDILYIFFKTHDPTTLNRQGNDVGEEYRSAIFYHNENQKKIAEEMKKELDGNGAFNSPIVTAIEPYKNFYKAEEDQQDFYQKNPNAGYCRVIIDPKVRKFMEEFEEKLKR